MNNQQRMYYPPPRQSRGSGMVIVIVFLFIFMIIGGIISGILYYKHNNGIYPWEEEESEGESEDDGGKAYNGEQVSLNSKIKEQEDTERMERYELIFDTGTETIKCYPDTLDCNGLNKSDNVSAKMVKKVAYDNYFSNTPDVFISVRGLDLEKGKNISYNVYVENVDDFGFEIVVEKKGNAIVWGIDVDWIALERTQTIDFGMSVGLSNIEKGSKEEIIEFDDEFFSIPQVFTSITSLETGSSTDVRVKTTVKDITVKGFTLVTETWGDSKIDKIGYSWFAAEIVEFDNLDEDELFMADDIEMGDFYENCNPDTKNCGGINKSVGDDKVHLKNVELTYFQEVLGVEGVSIETGSVKPIIILGLNSINTDKNHGLRVKLGADNVGSNSFKVKMETWNTSIVWGYGVSWFAITSNKDKDIIG